MSTNSPIRYEALSDTNKPKFLCKPMGPRKKKPTSAHTTPLAVTTCTNDYLLIINNLEVSQVSLVMASLLGRGSARVVEREGRDVGRKGNREGREDEGWRKEGRKEIGV